MGRSNNLKCPRCGGNFETLESYAHCVSCLYFEDYWFDTESAFHQAMKAKKEIPVFQDETLKVKKGNNHEDKECA